MSWAITIAAGPMETVWHRAAAEFERVVGLNPPPEMVDQIDAVVAMLKHLTHGVEQDPRNWVEGSAHGHANPDHAVVPGRAVDEISVTLKQVEPPPLEVEEAAPGAVPVDNLAYATSLVPRLVDLLSDERLADVKAKLADTKDVGDVRTLLRDLLK